MDDRANREAEIAAIAASMKKPVVWTAPSEHASAARPATTTTTTAAVSTSSPRSSSDPESDSSDSSDDDGDVFPVSELYEIPAHQKTVTCLGLDAAGGRMATGSLDGMVHLWDFAAGASLESPKPFRSLSGADSDARSGSQRAVATIFNSKR